MPNPSRPLHSGNSVRVQGRGRACAHHGAAAAGTDDVRGRDAPDASAGVEPHRASLAGGARLAAWRWRTIGVDVDDVGGGGHGSRDSGGAGAAARGKPQDIRPPAAKVGCGDAGAATALRRRRRRRRRRECGHCCRQPRYSLRCRCVGWPPPPCAHFSTTSTLTMTSNHSIACRYRGRDVTARSARATR